MDADRIADWHAQFAPKPSLDGAPRPELEAQVAVEHFAGDDGVFVPPAPIADEVEPEHDA